MTIVIAFVAGFCALGFEVLWYRAVDYANWGEARTFAVFLSAYLAGIAFGTLRVRRRLSRRSASWIGCGRLMLVASLVAGLFLPLLALVYAPFVAPLLYVHIFAAAALLGAILPYCIHLAETCGEHDSRDAGRVVGHHYAANIAGSAFGTLLVSFLFFDFLGTHVTAVVLSLMLVSVSCLVLVNARGRVTRRSMPLLLSGLVGGLLILGMNNFWERLLYKHRYDGTSFDMLVESRHGVIARTADGAVFGGGVYDGIAEVDLAHDRNGLVRLAVLLGLNRKFENVLMIGLGSGAWAAATTEFPNLKNLTIAELSPDYVELIAEPHTESQRRIARALSDSRVKHVVADGRHWLAGYQGEDFDALIMNTSWHWRSNATYVLSKEMLELGLSKLTDPGVLFFNTTGSENAIATALEVCPHVIRVKSFVACSRQALEPTLERTLAADVPFLKSKKAKNTVRDLFAGEVKGVSGIEFESSLRKRVDGVRATTDDNMAGEWKFPPIRPPVPGTADAMDWE